MIRAVDHVQVAAPPGSEDRLRAFHGGVLGMMETPKLPALADCGGCWFSSGAAALHIGIAAEFRFRPARKAHPGLEAAPIGPGVSRADGSRPAALSSVAAAPLRLPPPPCRTRPSTRSFLHAPYRRSLLRVHGIEAVASRRAAAGCPVTWDDRLPGHRRFPSEDPVGNRLEFLEPAG